MRLHAPAGGRARRRGGAGCELLHARRGARTIDRGQIHLNAFVGMPDGSEWITDRLEATADDPRGAGRELARRLRTAGAEDLLRRAESTLGA